ncbi:MAG: RNA 2',3'-cyclic phosphodiesterase [Coriobacteriia bacterium]|nr:RNA 2',3'-cyclic phosphodiesterase [Coriobacteriia bacterium]
MRARCFIAVPLGSEALALVADARGAFLGLAPEWAGEKWVRPDIVHMTLMYAGPLSDVAVDDSLQILADECLHHAPFELRLAGARAVPSHGPARMLWATLDGETHHCARLSSAISHVLEQRLDIPHDDRVFVPHVTLVRSRRPRPVPPRAVDAAGEALTCGKETDRIVSVRYVTLYASTLQPDGPVYEELGSVPLLG